MNPNIALITIDSLRYDSALAANTPYLHDLMKKYQRGKTGWVKTGAQATYTLLAHMSLFHAGILPCDNRTTVAPVYNRKKMNLFRAHLDWEKDREEVVFPTPAAPNIVKGFARLGYRTVGVGGVHWFDTRYETSGTVWSQYFDEFYWKPEFGELEFSAFEHQIELVRDIMAKSDDRPLFFFLNISSTHSPYLGNERSPAGQAKSLEYIDSHLPRLMEMLPQPLYLVMMADHGDCMGEDGLWGHAFYHPKVMEIPMAVLEIGFGFGTKIGWGVDWLRQSLSRLRA